MALLRRILLVLVLLLGQAHDFVPHVHEVEHRHDGYEAAAHFVSPDHLYSVAGDGEHRHDVGGHFDRCDQCRSNVGTTFLVAALPPTVPSPVIPDLDDGSPAIPEYRPDLPNAPPDERPSRGPPSSPA